MSSLILSFDIGYASIGWCVLSAKSHEPEFLGTGVVTFPTDDCLASQRRNLRRTRRHIRSTRQRIERMKRWLLHLGVLGRPDLDKPGHPAPFLLAAAALNGHRTLDAWELWTVLRWYAHNRGYDGNSRWANDQEDTEDTEKVQQANSLMEQHATETMCETVCACLGLNPAEHDVRISSTLPYKTLNAAYPRAKVTAEVGKLLALHAGKISKLDMEAVRLIMKSGDLTEAERQKLESAGIKLTKRYTGGLLFGQLVPRFDNRIIARCPVTWAKSYDDALADGKSDAEARKLADKFAKVPAAKCKEFLEYRFARILANLKANGEPLDKELRQNLWDLAAKQGRLTHSDIGKAIKQYCGAVPTNIDAYFKIHPDSEEALVLNPVMDEVRKAEGSRAKISSIWKLLPEDVRQETIALWQKGKNVSLAWMLDQAKDTPAAALLLAAVEKDFTALKPKRGNPPFANLDTYLLKTSVGPKFPTGRAPYARPVLRRVVEEVLNGHDSTKANKITDREKGEDKPENGVLYDLGIQGSRVRTLQAERPLDSLTNNHLVRHRMLILERLLDDIVAEFVTTGDKVARVIVEVARELAQFSGMDNQTIKTALACRMDQHKKAVALLQKHEIEPTYNLIKKCRIAIDLDWTCPYTNRSYGPTELSGLELDHIIPRSKRASDSMAGLVLTRKDINESKANRTALQFIIDSADDDRITSQKPYEDWVNKLKTAKKENYPDDHSRQNARKRFLLVQHYEEKERTFTPGQLTQSSHLMKLALIGVGKRFPDAICDPIPGIVTAEIRKSWNLTGTLALACPEIVGIDGKIFQKDEIRGLTHLHHALDASTLALAGYYFPLQHGGSDQKGKIWQSFLKRRRNDEEKKQLLALGCFKTYPRKRPNGQTEIDVVLQDLRPELKNELAKFLAECRVVQHIPSDQSGTKLEQSIWSVVAYEGKYSIVLQRINRNQLKVVLNDKHRRWENIPIKKEAFALLDRHGDKLTSRQRSLVERGLLKLTKEPTAKLIGPNPTTIKSKLQQHEQGRGAIVIGQNFGIAIEPFPTLIPFHRVHAALASLKKLNGGKRPQLLRNGSLISVATGTWKGCWRVTSVKNSEAYGISVDLARLHAVKMTKGNAKVPDMIRDGLVIHPHRYTGYPPND